MSEMFQIEEARREQGKLRLAITGATGSGKTYTSLNVGTRLGGRVCLIDTEHHSAAKYGSGKPFTFDTLVLKKPYSLDRYIAAIRFVESKGYDVCIIDSLTHAWAGTGGALEQVDDAARRNRGNSYTAWRDVTPMHRNLIETILGSNMHIIATMRSKMDYVQEKDAQGKTVVRKVGLAPVQRDDMSYEFDIVGDLDTDHVMVISKSRCAEIDGQVIHKPGAELAAALKAWLSDGDPVTMSPGDMVLAGGQPAGDPEPEGAPEGTASQTGLSAWNKAKAVEFEGYRKKVAEQIGTFTDADMKGWLKSKYGIDSRKEATAEMLEALKNWMIRCHRAGRIVE